MEKKIEAVVITTPFIKLNSFLKFAGAAETGGQAKELVQGEDVLVNRSEEHTSELQSQR